MMKQKLLNTLLIGASLAIYSAHSLAGDTTRHYTISGGTLSSALNHFASEAGILLSANAALTQGKYTDGLEGDYTTEAGLKKLLQDSGLKFVRDDKQNYVLQAKNTSSDLSTSQPAPSNENASVDLEALMVVGTPQSRYDSREVLTGVRIVKDITEVPRTVDVIPEQLLLDTQARELEDVYKLAPNVVNSDGFGGTREDYLIRGFRRPADIYRNGVRLKTGRRFDPATVDNIQIIKGPVADIGQMMPGGLVNIVTKKPQINAEHHIATSFDEHGQRRAVFDSTGAIDDNEQFAYRVTGSLEDSETFREFSELDREFLSSSLSWFGDRGAYLNLNHEYTHEQRSMDRGLVTTSTDGGNRTIANVPVDQRFDAPFSLNEVHSNLFELDAALPLGTSAWLLESKLLYNGENTDDVHVEVRNVASDGTLTRQVQGNKNRSLDTFFGRLQARGEFDLMSMQLVAGLEYHQQDEDWINFAGAAQTGGTVSTPHSFTLINDADSPDRRFDIDTQNKSYGPFAQLDITPVEDLTLTLGARQEYYSGDFRRVNLDTGEKTDVKQPRDNKFSKSAGLVWKVVPDLSLYTSYADTFIAQSIFGNQEVALLQPQEGRQYEVGTKWSTLDDRLLLTLAFFDIKQTNVIETVNGEPELTGGIETEGVEFSLVGSPIRGWNIRAALGLLDAEIVSEDPDTNGNRPRNVPEHTASLWTSYEFQGLDSPFSGLGIGAGVTHVGNRYGDNDHSFDLGDYTLVDAGIWYYLPVGSSSLRFDLGVKNITDEEYFTASGGAFRIAVGAPRTVFGGVRLDF